MLIDQILISAIILISLGLFIWGKWRTDVVALLALFSAMVLGLVPLEEMFAGFIHPVIVLVIAMVVISKGLVNSGVVDIVARHLKFADKHSALQLALLVAFTAFLSAFINSMGALAFVIPIAIRMARQSGAPLSMFLLPIAFASHFGGSITLVGSASNIIVSGFRAQDSTAFGFFDFALVALPVAIVGIIFVSLIGWRFIPKREDVFARRAGLERYATEIKVPGSSPMVGKNIQEFKKFSKEYFTLTAIVRDGQRIPEPSPFIVLQAEDILLIEAKAEALEAIVATAELELVWKKPFTEIKKTREEELETIEVVIPATSSLAGETAKELRLHYNYRINLLALHRPGAKIATRLGDMYFRRGDVLVIQGYSEEITHFVKIFGLLPLKEQEFHFEGKKQKALLASGIFALAVIISIFTTFPVHLVFATAALAIVVGGFISTKEMYQSVDLSIVVLLAVMLQIGFIFQSTGAASALASSFISLPWEISPTIALGTILLASIWVSDILSNATVAVIFAPVAISMASILNVSADPFLIAVAIGSASSYLTPLGHQSNSFVMSIGGYRFGDYWKLGLPLEIVTFATALPLILRFWPF